MHRFDFCWYKKTRENLPYPISCGQTISSWWFQFVKLDHFPKVWGENKECLKPPPRKAFELPPPRFYRSFCLMFCHILYPSISYILWAKPLWIPQGTFLKACGTSPPVASWMNSGQMIRWTMLPIMFPFHVYPRVN